MHRRVKRVVGRIEAFCFNDEAKSVGIVAKIDDTHEWQRVVKGHYTGLSIAGTFTFWDDPKDRLLRRYTVVPEEISLVDYPCNPAARFQIWEDNGHSCLSRRT